jgi:hypothetical protein
MPTPTIPDGELFMNATIWTGSGTTTRSITNGITGQSFQPDFVWAKSRSLAIGHTLYDSVRGAGASKALFSNSTEAEGGTLGSTASSEFGYISSLDSNGFSTSSGSVNGNYVNSTSNTYVAWQWKAGGAAVTNTSGTISSQVSANTTSGFSVATFTTAGANATIGHGLGVAPRMIFMKDRTNAASWLVYNASLASAANYLVLNASDASASNTTVWNNTAPTSSVFSIGTVWAASNYVAYCWAPIAGYSAFGSYTGNGSADGTFVYLGFRPRFIMIKRTDTAEGWYMLDTSRSTYNLSVNYLDARSSGAETTADFFDILSNGFKLRTTGGYANASGGTYIYMAFAENPFKYANAR